MPCERRDRAHIARTESILETAFPAVLEEVESWASAVVLGPEERSALLGV